MVNWNWPGTLVGYRLKEGVVYDGISNPQAIFLGGVQDNATARHGAFQSARELLDGRGPHPSPVARGPTDRTKKKMSVRCNGVPAQFGGPVSASDSGAMPLCQPECQCKVRVLAD